MYDEDEALEREANRATIRSAWYTKVSIVLAVLALLWTIFSDLVLSDDDATSSSQQTTTSSQDAESTSEPIAEESTSVVDDFVGYFKQAATDTDEWRTDQAIWQLVVWWIVSLVLFAWCAQGPPLLPTFRTGAVVLGAYLWIFWPSLSGFGAGLAFGVTTLIILVATALEA